MAGNKATIATNTEINAAMARVQSEPDNTPLATTAKHIPALDLFIVDLNDGSRMVLQREHLQGLQNATKQQLAKVEILGRGTGLHWEDPDADLYVPALKKGIFGNKQWMRELRRKRA